MQRIILTTLHETEMMAAARSRSRRSWKYCVGVGISLTTGGYLGYFIFRLLFRFVFGPNPMDGFVSTITQLERNQAMAVGTAVILGKNGLAIVGGLALYFLYDRLVQKVTRTRSEIDPGKGIV